MNAEAGMGMSLDDMIKQNRKANKKKSPTARRPRQRPPRKVRKEPSSIPTQLDSRALIADRSVTFFLCLGLNTRL